MLDRAVAGALTLLITFYQWTISPLLPTRCRFVPSCSAYTREAIREWGALRGLWLGIRRISRCHPCGGWGFDPAPKRERSKPD